MNFGAIGVVGIAVLLCGCSDADWNNALSYGGAGPSDTTVASSTSAPPAVDSASLPPPQSEGPSSQMAQTAVAPQPSYSVTQTVTTVTPVAPVNPTVSYCRQTAQGSGAVATRDGDDASSQQQAADATYQACLRLYGASDH